MFRALHLGTKLGFNTVRSALSLPYKSPQEMMQDIGGVYAKAAQITSMHDKDASCFSECTPYNLPELEQRYAEYCQLKGLDPENGKLVASGSIGGVYKYTLDDERTLAIKIRYPGIRECIKNDANAVRGLGVFVSVEMLEEVMNETLKELDYEAERCHCRIIHKICRDEGLPTKTPVVVEEFCTRKSDERDDVIAMEFIKGSKFVDFIRKTPKADRQQVFQPVFEEILGLLFSVASNGYLIADPHWGNFLYNEEERALYVLDFGNVVNIEREMVLRYLEIMAHARSDVREYTQNPRWNQVLKKNMVHMTDHPERISPSDTRLYYEANREAALLLFSGPRVFTEKMAEPLNRMITSGKMGRSLNSGTMVFKMLVVFVNMLCHTGIRFDPAPIMCSRFPELKHLLDDGADAQSGVQTSFDS